MDAFKSNRYNKEFFVTCAISDMFQVINLRFSPTSILFSGVFGALLFSYESIVAYPYSEDLQRWIYIRRQKGHCLGRLENENENKGKEKVRRKRKREKRKARKGNEGALPKIGPGAHFQHWGYPGRRISILDIYFALLKVEYKSLESHFSGSLSSASKA